MNSEYLILAYCELRIVSVMTRFCKQTAEIYSLNFLFKIGPRVYFLMLGGLTWL